MRRALVLGLGLVLAAAAPAQAEEVVVTGTDALAWDKTDVPIKPGDTVTWQFPGTAQFHNVAIQFPEGLVRSTGSVPAPPFSQTFDRDGTYEFVCEVHRDTMRGTVRVSAGELPPAAEPPLSAQAYHNDNGAVGPLETNVKVDKAKPRLSSVSARRSGKRAARVRFKVSEDSDVTVAFKRGGRTVKSARASGTGTRWVTVRGLQAGRYVVQVRATDIAGNRSKLRTLRLSVR